MAIAVADAAPVRIWENTESEGEQTVRNDGPDAVVVSRDPQVTASAEDGFSIAANGSVPIWLRPGDGLYAICAAGQTASVEVI